MRDVSRPKGKGALSNAIREPRNILTMLMIGALLGIALASPATSATRPNPILPTPKYVPKAQTPRFFVASNAESQLVWTLRNPPVKDTFTYYYIEQPTGRLNVLRYNLSIDEAGSDFLLTLSRNGLRCRTYHGRFDSNEQVLSVQDRAHGPPQAFSVMDDDELAITIRILQQDAAMQSGWYRDMRKHHYKIPSASYQQDVDPRFSPRC